MPTKIDTKKLCRDLGRKPFEDLDFKNNHAKCPFHNGDTNTSLSIKEGSDGVWFITCHSECNKSWNAISYVMQRNSVPFLEAVRVLGGKTSDNGTASHTPEKNAPKSKPKAMMLDEWNAYGRELTPDDIVRLAKTRKDKTASFETFKALGCRVKGDWLAFPHFKTVYDPDTGESDVEFFTVKLRHLDQKEFDQEHCTSQKEFFNLDTVNALEDVYVLEGEPDVAVMEEAGFRAVGVVSGSQKKFSKAALRTLAIAPRVFLVGDQGEDDPGQACMDELQKQELLPPEKTFRIRFDNAHDVCELARKTGNGFRSYIEQLRDDSLEPWVMEHLPTITELSQEPEKWVIDRLFLYGGLTMLTGSKGSMKSLLAMFAAQAISASHRKFLGRDVMFDNIPVLYVDRENPESTVSSRARYMGVLGNRDFPYWGDTHNGEPTPEVDDPRLMEFARRKNGFIIFDSLQDWYGDENENDNSAMVKLMGKFRKLARAGAGVLVLHHKNADGTKARGGTAIPSLTDMAILAAKSENDENVIELRKDRFRSCAAWEIDFRAHWDAGEFHDRQKHYQFELLRDQLEADAIRDKKGQKAKASEEKASKDAADTERALAAIKESRSAPATLSGKLSMRRERLVRLVGNKGVTWDADAEKWNGIDFDELF
jgi:hypothetical protein